jgi:plasmid stability protein
MNLSIKNAPDQLVEKLKERARRNHRSLQGELMAILEAAAGEERQKTPAEILSEIRKIGLQSRSESAEIVRAMRDAR